MERRREIGSPRSAPRRPVPHSGGVSTGLARALSKLGFCSRAQAWDLIRAGRVRLNGVVQRNPEQRVALGRDRIVVDDATVRAQEHIYFALNKPRGLVTTLSDEKGRPTVMDCFRDQNLPFLSPVGRLDQASEGLLLLTNDTAWAARLSAPETHVEKTYHVQIDAVPDAKALATITRGMQVEGELLSAKRVALLRVGTKNSWLEVVLDEGRNRQIRRLLSAFGFSVLRLIRVAIGDLELGNLPKGSYRRLTAEEVARLRR